MTEADKAERDLDSIMLRIADARRSFVQNSSDEARRKIEEIEEESVLAKLGFPYADMRMMAALADHLTMRFR